MQLGAIDSEREVVPRWRAFDSAARKADLQSIETRSKKNVDEELSNIRHEVRTSPSDEWVAADYLSATISSLARRPEILAAAEHLASVATSEMLVQLAASTIDGNGQNEVRLTPDRIQDTKMEAIRHVGQARRFLSRSPRDGITRVDLALAHTILGNRRTARREMIRAIQLEPTNRFVLRSAAAFFVESDEPDRAFEILTAHDLHRFDPWIAAASLAAGELSENRLEIRTAREMLHEGRFPPRAITELASELGTIESRSGRRKPGRLYFSQSLIDPNENALAQAAWAVKAVGLSVPEPTFRAFDAFEARHRDFHRQGDWKLSFEEGRRWQADQPFSREAGASTSYVASMGLEDYQAALDAASLALMADPTDPTLTNNAAFAAAQLGEIDKAERYLSHASPYLAADEALVITATRGLIAFRRGDVESGRSSYRAAIEGFAEEKMRTHVAMAVNLLASEEVRIRSLQMHDAVNAARIATSGLPTESPEAELLLERLENAYSSTNSNSI